MTHWPESTFGMNEGVHLARLIPIPCHEMLIWAYLFIHVQYKAPRQNKDHIRPISKLFGRGNSPMNSMFIYQLRDVRIHRGLH